MDDKELRDKQDRVVGPTSEELDADLDAPSIEGCPTCGNEDIQSAELLEAWKELEGLRAQIVQSKEIMGKQSIIVSKTANVDLGKLNQKVPMDRIVPGAPTDWEFRYKKIKEAYIKTRLEVSGSFGNWDYATRKRVLENEISAELDFKV
ncbi:hypothetical protein LCGC14_0836790 [marine sediment metagenome]|uniref:Uncharacterized protein n=1 Tax=marine sediment metagenome TaxID=412755 RepID=A0A0F9PEA6_9ZZZZ